MEEILTVRQGNPLAPCPITGGEHEWGRIGTLHEPAVADTDLFRCARCSVVYSGHEAPAAPPVSPPRTYSHPTAQPVANRAARRHKRARPLSSRRH